MRHGLVLAGAAHDVLTIELVTESFGYPIRIEHHDGRWRARADRILV